MTNRLARLLVVGLVLTGTAWAQTLTEIRAAVEESRERLAVLASPLVTTTPECPTPAPKSEFENTAAFEKRLAAAELACAELRKEHERQGHAEKQHRSNAIAVPLILPVWNAMARYDADREVFLLSLTESGAPTITVGASEHEEATLHLVAAKRGYVCTVPVSATIAPHWREHAQIFVRFRLNDTLNERSLLDKSLSANDATLLVIDDVDSPPRAIPVALCEVGVSQARGAALRNEMRVLRPGVDVTLPTVLRQVQPAYTADAMRAKVEGTALLECVVMPDGSVGEVRVTKSLDTQFGLDQEAIKAAKMWRFRPGMRRGEPVPVIITIELTFKLR